MDIPVIDLSSLGTRRASVIGQLAAAARTSGFFFVIGHSVPSTVVHRQFEEARAFFDLSAAQKEVVAMGHSVAMRGYERLGAQTLDATANADLKESFQCGIDYPSGHPYVARGYPSYGPNQWPSELPSLRAASERYTTEMRSLAATIMSLLAESLDLDSEYFARLDKQPCVTLRMLRYPPQPTGSAERTFGAGAHTDWGAVTILAQDGHGGLEVNLPDGRWVPATPIDGSFVVNLGDMIPRWTNDRYRSNPHRVKNTLSDGKDRYSIAFFADLDYEALIEPLLGCVSPDGVVKYPPCTVGEHMAQMYANTYGSAAA